MSRFQKWSIWVTSALTVLTGLGYFVTKYLLASPDPYAVVNHPWQPWFLKAHVLVSPLLLFALGMIVLDHVWEHFVTGVQLSRRSAMLTAAAVVPMVLTGYLIQVLTDEGWVRSMAIAHIVFGFLYGLGLAVHSWVVARNTGAGSASRREAGSAASADRARGSRGPTGGPPPPHLEGRSGLAEGEAASRPEGREAGAGPADDGGEPAPGARAVGASSGPDPG